MSSARVSSPGFVTVLGRGYRPKEVDTFTAALSAERDAAWERVTRLTMLAKDMVVEAKRLREACTEIKPQTYDTLGERARRLWDLAQEEAAGMVERARQEAAEEVAQAEEHAETLGRTAQEQAETIRTQAKEHAHKRLLAARAEAQGIRVTARRKVKEFRGAELDALRDVRQRTAGLLVEPKHDHAEKWAEADRELAERIAAMEANNERAVARAEEALAAAQREFTEAQESIGRRQEEARARATQILAEARLKEDRIAQETERVVRKHHELSDEVRAHMEQVQESLRALTGRPAE